MEPSLLALIGFTVGSAIVWIAIIAAHVINHFQAPEDAPAPEARHAVALESPDPQTLIVTGPPHAVAAAKAALQAAATPQQRPEPSDCLT